MKGKTRSEAQLELYEVMEIQTFAYRNETWRSTHGAESDIHIEFINKIQISGEGGGLSGLRLLINTKLQNKTCNYLILYCSIVLHCVF
jgi:hypothetical protein